MEERLGKKLYESGVAHPAVFSDRILPVLAGFLEPQHRVILDPFAGVGRVHELPRLLEWEVRTHGIELEPEWAVLHPHTQVGSALALPFPDTIFDAVVTSPTYGNRLADHHNARDSSLRRSYTHDLGRTLSANNSGVLHWGPDYRQFHVQAWQEAKRVLRPGGRVVLNISDHIRNHRRQFVVSWHCKVLIEMGFALVDAHRVVTPRLRVGANGAARVPAEQVLAFDLVE